MLNSNYVGIAYSTEKNIQIERKKLVSSRYTIS